MKFQREYRLTIQPNDGGDAIVLDSQFTLQFNLVRGASATLNTGAFVIYNLGENTRNRIFKDRFNLSIRQTIIMEAGYGDQLSVVFVGDIYEAFSQRQGADITTTIMARDGGFDATGTKTIRTFKEGISRQEVLRDLIGDFPNLEAGTIAGDNSVIFRPIVIDGNTWQKIQVYSNYSAFIDLGEVNVVDNKQAKQGLVQVIDASTGLLETPRREDASLVIKTLFEPRIIMSQVIEINSSIQPIYNGQYKVLGVKHSGVISQAVGGECVSEFNFLLGTQLFGAFEIV